MTAEKYETKKVGSKYSESFEVYIKRNGKIISPFHDIPLFSSEYVNAVNEIPRFEHAKFEISKNLEMNPIVQDKKNGKVRFVKNVFPFNGYPINYGAIPQTYEDPKVLDDDCKAYGDNDPLDCVEIGTRTKEVGEVYQAKVLGCLALLDDNEADWKIVLIDSQDENADQLNDISDVERIFPNLLEGLFSWFRDYKKPDGKPANQFALDGKFQNAEFAKRIIKETHEHWKNLMKKDTKEISLKSEKDGDFEVSEKETEISEKSSCLNIFYFAK